MQYPGVLALDGVSTSFREGFIQGLVGENGAGKSTLLKILSGVQQPTSGQISVDGKDIQLKGVRHAEHLGIAMIHQELNLIDTLSICENIYLGTEPKSGPFINRAEMSDKSSVALRKIGLEVDPNTPVGELSLAQKQMLEIAKAIHRGAKVVIMDEPSAVLAEKETERLLELCLELKSQGVGVIYVSHRLDEVVKICDAVTVLRDGKVVGELTGEEITPHNIATQMVGRELSDLYPEKKGGSETVALTVSGLIVEGFPTPINLDLKAGEIIGIGGLVGSGRTEVAEAIAGLRKKREGTIASQKIAYVSEDRKGTGLFLGLDAVENSTMSNLRAFAKPLINDKKRVSVTRDWIEKLGVRISSPDVQVGTLSGGNQQKISLAKCLETKPSVLILDEPTRGVDIGAKSEIYRLVRSLADEGMAFLVISSEMQELIGLCTRVYVMREKKLVGELSGDEITEQNMMFLAAGVAA